MAIEVRPARDFADVRTMVGPKNDPDANVCWCVSYRRVPPGVKSTLVGGTRAAYVEQLCRQELAPGVLAYEDDEVVGWAAVAPRSATTFANSRKIPRLDDLDTWSIWCVRVRPGYRKRGITHALIDGAVEFARTHGAPAIEAYPVDNRGKKVDQTMAFVGTRAMFEKAGFTLAAPTDAVSGGFPRVVMRRDLL